jgi:putative two-component system response regulator
MDRIHGAHSVLVIDDIPENLRLLCEILKRAGLVPRPVTTGRRGIEAAIADPPDLVLLDVRMPGMSGLEVCRWLKQDKRLSAIPVIFISGSQDLNEKIEAFRSGGVDYISKPFHEAEAVERIKTHLRLKDLQIELSTSIARLESRIAEQVREITASHMETIFALAKLAEARDNDTGRHVERVQAYSRALAERMYEDRIHATVVTSSFIENIFEAASLHDIGKVGIPDAILLKPAKLTDEEFKTMKVHSLLGGDTLAAVLKRFPDNRLLGMGVEIARSHHEKWNGSGYPDGLTGEGIPLSARLVAVADVYDALTSKRCYHDPFSHREACGFIQEGSGSQFDPVIAEVARKIEPNFLSIRKRLGDA